MVTLPVVLLVCFGCLCTNAFRRLASNFHPHQFNITVDENKFKTVARHSGSRSLSEFSFESHLVSSLPGLGKDTQLAQYAGHITIDEAKGSNIFYWLFEAPENPDKLPLLVWMNGGPGCSSMDGLWLELGPLRLEKSGDRISVNKHSWHNVANLLFIDQPVGTGFAFTKSKSGFATNDEAVNLQFYKFLIEFFKLHPRYVQAVDGRPTSRAFFMSGESHAGHYIPTMAAYIMRKNDLIRQNGGGDPIIAIEGVALGNPWLDPYYQYDASDFAHGLGLISLGQKHRLKELERKCQALLAGGKFNNPACFSLLDRVIDSTAVGAAQRVLMYDARQFVKSTSSFPPGHEPLERYLNRPDVKAAIHATGTPHKFEECANPPFYALSHQDGKGVTKELTEILDRGLRVLVFAGQYDLICNHVGIERVLRRVEWRGQKDWLLAASGTWAPEGKPVGFVRAHQNLEFLIVLDSGHMVPMDQPAVALSMIETFLRDRRFAATSSQTKLGVALDAPGENRERCPRSDAYSSVASSNEPAAPEGGTPGGGFSFWPTLQQKKQQQQKKAPTSHLRKSRPRRNFSAQTPESVRFLEEEVKNRSLEEENGDSDGKHYTRQLFTESANAQASPFHSSSSSSFSLYSLVLGHVTPLNGSVLVHLRLLHQGSAAHLQHHHHSDRGSVAAALAGQTFEVSVMPGYRAVPIELAALLENRLSTDILIDGLQDGVEYSFTTVVVDDKQGVRHPSSRRVVTATPGCFDPHTVQCCGNGRCAATGAGSQAPSAALTFCRCDAGYLGHNCHQIAAHPMVGAVSIQLVDTSVSCPAHFHAHSAQLLSLNTSTSSANRADHTSGSPSIKSTQHSATVSIETAPEQSTVKRKYCDISADVAATACVFSLQMHVSLDSVDSSGSLSWLSKAVASKDYQTAVAALLEADVNAALSSASGELGVDLSASVGTLATPLIATPAVAKQGTLPVLLRISGPAECVNALVSQLIQQVEQPTSKLHVQGVLGKHLSGDFDVVTHKASLQDETHWSDMWMWVGLALVTGLVFTFRWCCFRSLS